MSHSGFATTGYENAVIGAGDAKGKYVSCSSYRCFGPGIFEGPVKIIKGDKLKLTVVLLGFLPTSKSGMVASKSLGLECRLTRLRFGFSRASREKIVQSFATLKLSQLYGAIAYYLENEETIDEYLVEGERETGTVGSSSARRIRISLHDWRLPADWPQNLTILNPISNPSSSRPAPFLKIFTSRFSS